MFRQELAGQATVLPRAVRIVGLGCTGLTGTHQMECLQFYPDMVREECGILRKTNAVIPVKILYFNGSFVLQGRFKDLFGCFRAADEKGFIGRDMSWRYQKKPGILHGKTPSEDIFPGGQEVVSEGAIKFPENGLHLGLLEVSDQFAVGFF